MIERVENEKGLERFDLKFAAYFPTGYEVKNITVRHGDTRWPTIRYEFTGEVSGRVKEFFMDWFYYGFPKNLMSSIVDSYSTVDAFRGISMIYLGKDYKGMDAATASIYGTHVEVEFDYGSMRERIDFMNSMKTSDYQLKRVSHLRYHERGFHTLGNPGDWFEDLRIARLSWRSLDDRLDAGRQIYNGSSEGILESAGMVQQVYMVYEQNGFEKAVSIDAWRRDVSVEHVKYRLRKGGNFFTSQIETPSLALFKSEYGPAFFAFGLDNIEGIIALSGGFDSAEAELVHQACLHKIDGGLGL